MRIHPGGGIEVAATRGMAPTQRASITAMALLPCSMCIPLSNISVYLNMKPAAAGFAANRRPWSPLGGSAYVVRVGRCGFALANAIPAIATSTPMNIRAMPSLMYSMNTAPLGTKKNMKKTLARVHTT